MNNPPVPLGGNGHGIIPVAEPVTVTISQDAADHLVAWSLDSRTKSLHEASHCVAATALSVGVMVASIKSAAGGHCELSLHNEDQPTLSLDSLVRREIVVTLAGLAGEVEFLGEGSIGNQMDLVHATELAIKRLDNGLEPGFPPVSMSVWPFGSIPPALANLQSELVIAEMRRAQAEAIAIIHEHRDQVLGFASLLYQARRLEGTALDAALRSVGLEPAQRDTMESR